MKKATPWLVLIVILLAAGAWYFLAPQPADTHPSVKPLADAPPAVSEPVAEYPVTAIVPEPEPLPAPEPLPSIEESDAAIIEALAGLVGPESLDAHFVLEQVISRIVATIDSLPSRQIAPLVMPLQPAPGNFMVLSAGDTLAISPENEQRYLPYIDLAQRTDTGLLVSTYVRFYPLFQEAYEALGYPDGYFNDRLVEVIDHLLETPETDGPVGLVKPEAVYLFEDETLESLSAGQKIMLRIGPDNATAVRRRLQEIRAALTRQSL